MIMVQQLYFPKSNIQASLRELALAYMSQLPDCSVSIVFGASTIVEFEIVFFWKKLLLLGKVKRSTSL